MASVLAPEFSDVDFARLARICLLHDLGEAVSGDVPAPEQARRLAENPAARKAPQERRDLLTLLAPLPEPRRNEIAALWDETRPRRRPRPGSPRRWTSWKRLSNTTRAATHRTSTIASVWTTDVGSPPTIR